MEPIKYPYRCVNHLFGYCGKGVRGVNVQNADGSVRFAGCTGGCKEDWAACKDFVSNTVANPYHPELEKSSVVTVLNPPVEDKRKKKPAKQEALVK